MKGMVAYPTIHNVELVKDDEEMAEVENSCNCSLRTGRICLQVDLYALLVFGAATLLNLLDIMTTKYLLIRGLGAEANPVMRLLFDYGVETAASLKFLIVMVPMVWFVILFVTRKSTTMLRPIEGFAIVQGYIVVSNFVSIIAMT